jgi:hypothetical protein
MAKTNPRRVRPAPILFGFENDPANSRTSHIANMAIPPVINLPLI